MTRYWRARSLEIDKSIFKDAEAYAVYLDQEYQKAIEEIDRLISYHLMKISDEQGVSLQGAKKLLSVKERLRLENFIKLSQMEMTEPLNRALNLESRRARISRLQAMELELKTSIAKLMTREEKGLYSQLEKTYTNKYYQTIYGMQRITGFETLAKVDPERLKTIILNPWLEDGSNFSDRIWGRGDKLVMTLRKELTQSLALGRHPKEIARQFAKTMNTSRSNAYRLLMTETSAINSKANQDAFEKLGAPMYEINATLDMRTSYICREMDGRKFEMKDYKLGITAPPFHPYCRTTIIPSFNDDIEREIDEAVGRIARRTRKGKSRRVGNLTYKEWFEKYVNR